MKQFNKKLFLIKKYKLTKRLKYYKNAFDCED
jgi:hypothetical protein